MSDNSDDLRPHVDTDVCGRCRKKLNTGDRVTTAYIFAHRGVNPLNLGNSGAFLYEEFELVHIDCRDPLLKKGVLNG